MKGTKQFKEFVEKPGCLADVIEDGNRFEIQIAGEPIYVPARAIYNIEHECNGDGGELDSRLKGQTGMVLVRSRTSLVLEGLVY